jgi:hypothetical protein
VEVADSEGDAWNQNRCTNKANIAALKLTINVNHEQRELRLEVYMNGCMNKGS